MLIELDEEQTNDLMINALMEEYKFAKNDSFAEPEVASSIRYLLTEWFMTEEEFAKFFPEEYMVVLTGKRLEKATLGPEGEAVSFDYTWVDPPSGWKYGFPKVMTKEESKNVDKFLKDQGYGGDSGFKFCRFWKATEEEYKRDRQS